MQGSATPFPLAFGLLFAVKKLETARRTPYEKEETTASSQRLYIFSIVQNFTHQILL